MFNKDYLHVFILNPACPTTLSGLFLALIFHTEHILTGLVGHSLLSFESIVTPTSISRSENTPLVSPYIAITGRLHGQPLVSWFPSAVFLEAALILVFIVINTRFVLLSFTATTNTHHWAYCMILTSFIDENLSLMIQNSHLIVIDQSIMCFPLPITPAFPDIGCVSTLF